MRLGVPFIDDARPPYRRVVDAGGHGVGLLREGLQPGANDVYVVAREGRSDLLLPAIAGVVLEIRIDERTVVVDVPPGLDRERTR